MSDDDEPQAALGAGQMDDADEEPDDQVGAVRDYATPSARYQPY